jgi:large subunit ribosomal protein L18
MIKKFDRQASRAKRQSRIRAKISGTQTLPRLSVYRSNKNIFAQIIDDTTGVTLVEASSLKSGKAGNVNQAKTVGTELAKKAKAKKITAVVFDRGGYLYHGRVKALADAAREAGLEF